MASSKLRSPAARHREILRPFYSLLGVLVLAGAALLLSGAAWERTQRTFLDRLERQHLPGPMLGKEASKGVADLDRLLQDAWLQGATPALGQREDAVLQAIAQTLDSLAALAVGGEATAQGHCIQRARRHQGAIVTALEAGRTAPGPLQAHVEALEISLFQLSRLHSAGVEGLLARLETHRRRGLLILAAGSLLVVLLAGVLVIWILASLRARLAEHQRTEEALLHRERELQQASKMEALGTLVGGVAHDFNNLLTAVLGNADRLLGEVGSHPRIAGGLREIQRAGERAAGLTRQLLAFSRNEAIQPRVVRPGPLLRELYPLLRRLIPEDIDLSMDLADGLHPVLMDPVQMEQVMINLVVNARDAMPGGGRIRIQAGNVSRQVEPNPAGPVPGGNYVRVRVEDDGEGMPPEVRERVFEPFFTTKEIGRGTGLGLATVHGIIRRLGGFVEVRSEAGRGSCFDLYLPRAEAPALEELAEGTAAGELGGWETILVVEDEDQVRRLAVTGLQEAGYRTLEASHGAEALAICRSHVGPIHLLLTDVVMPGMQGHELAERIRGERPEIRVIYMSGYTQDAPLGGMAPDTAPVMAKPFKLSELLAMVRDELGRIPASPSTSG